MLTASKIFYPVMHKCKYAKVVLEDTALLQKMKTVEDLFNLQIEASLCNMSFESLHQGTDVIQEEVNKSIIELLGPDISWYTFVFHKFTH